MKKSLEAYSCGARRPLRTLGIAVGEILGLDPESVPRSATAQPCVVGSVRKNTSYSALSVVACHTSEAIVV